MTIYPIWLESNYIMDNIRILDDNTFSSNIPDVTLSTISIC